MIILQEMICASYYNSDKNDNLKAFGSKVLARKIFANPVTYIAMVFWSSVLSVANTALFSEIKMNPMIIRFLRI